MKVRGAVRFWVVGVTLAFGTVALAVSSSGGSVAETQAPERSESVTPSASRHPASQPTAQGSPFRSALDEFQQAYSDYLAKVLAGKHLGIAVSGEPARKPNALLKAVVTAAFQQETTFEGVRRLLGNAVQWEEMPERVFDQERWAEDRIPGMERGKLNDVSETTLPIVLYKHTESGTGNSLTIMQNAFAIDDNVTNRFRIRFDPYAAVQTSDGVWVSCLTDDTQKDPSLRMPSTSYLVLDAISGDYALPAVAMVDVPVGTGHYLTLFAVGFDTGSRSWRNLDAKEFSEVSAWEYEPSKGLSITETFRSGTEKRHQIDVAAFARSALQKQKEKVHDLRTVSAELKAALQAFKEQYEVYWQKVLMQRHMGGDTAEPCVQPNALLRDVVLGAFREGLRLTDVERLLDGVAEWQKMPERLVDDDRRAGDSSMTKGLEVGLLESADQSKLPVVLYNQLRAASGTTVTVLQNTFITDYLNGYVRNRMEPYVVVASSDSIEGGLLTTDYTRSAYGEGAGPFFLFLVPEIVETDYPVPGVAVLETPWGSGHFLRLLSFTFDLESRSWKEMDMKEWSPTFAWEYTRANGLLAKVSIDSDPLSPLAERRVDVRTFVREGVEKMKKGQIQ